MMTMNALCRRIGGGGGRNLTFMKTRRKWTGGTTRGTTMQCGVATAAYFSGRHHLGSGAIGGFRGRCASSSRNSSSFAGAIDYGSDPLSSSSGGEEEESRESMAVDVLIVGGGPAGLSTAIRLKQLCLERDHDLSVCLIDKGSEIGSHILSGNVFDPKAMNELLPDNNNSGTDDPSHWTKELEELTGSIATPVRDDRFLVLPDDERSFGIPNMLLPSQLHNDGNYIISLSQMCRYLASKAEELGVDIYPGFAASHVLLDDETKTTVRGVVTRDVGLDKDGKPKSTYEKGMELIARQTVFCEGARGPCTQFLEKHFDLRKDCHPQTYGLGIKEVWQIPQEKLQSGLVQHTVGYPLQSGIMDKTFGGSFLYHQEPDLILIGLVVGLDYSNPYLHPYKEFQRFKTHPSVREHLEGGTCVSYGARVLNEGGYHSIPKLTVPGAIVAGCSAGFLNAVKIKGTHTAMKSGMIAAECIFDGLSKESIDCGMLSPVAETGELPDDYVRGELSSYGDSIRDSWIHKELYEIRNTHEAFARWGIGGGMAYTGLSTFITKGKEPWTLSHTKIDADATDDAERHVPIEYPQPDNVLTFDLLTNLQRSGTYHADDQPCHLRIKPNLQHVPESVSLQQYAGPESRFCPAAVYEYVDDVDGEEKAEGEGGTSTKKKLVINSQNCLHCFTCSLKTPKEYIQWTVPEGGGGPQYQIM